VIVVLRHNSRKEQKGSKVTKKQLKNANPQSDFFLSKTINLPLTRIIKDRFGFPKAKPEKREVLPSQISDLEFLEKLAEDDRLFFDQGEITTNGTIVSVTPQTGTTFFFLGAVIENTDTVTGEFQVTNNGIIRELVTLPQDAIHDFVLPMDKLVGNSLDIFLLEGLTANVEARASLYGWFENTKKIQ